MSMTREEAIGALVACRMVLDFHQIDAPEYTEAMKMAIRALRPVSREQVEKVWGSEWEYDHETIIDHFSMVRCSKCGREAFEKALYVTKGRFCPACGAAMTDEAVQMVVERLEALKDGNVE